MTTEDLIEARKYLISNLVINIIDVFDIFDIVVEQCKNDEYVYYFTSNMKYITL